MGKIGRGGGLKACFDLLYALFSLLSTSSHGFDGRACLLKSFCTAALDVDKSQQKSGMLFKLLKVIFR